MLVNLLVFDTMSDGGATAFRLLEQYVGTRVIKATGVFQATGLSLYFRFHTRRECLHYEVLALRGAYLLNLMFCWIATIVLLLIVLNLFIITRELDRVAKLIQLRKHLRWPGIAEGLSSVGKYVIHLGQGTVEALLC